MPGHDVYLVAFDLAGQTRLRLSDHDPGAQLLGHMLHVILVQPQLLGNLVIGDVQAHQIQAHQPDLQGLMMTGKHRPAEVVKVAPTGRAAIFLACRLRHITALFADPGRGAMRAAHALGPAQAAHRLVALGVVKQILQVNHHLTQFSGRRSCSLPDHAPVSDVSLPVRNS